MRSTVGLIIIILTLTLGVCLYFARRSHKSIAPYVSWMVGALILPMAGNIIIIISDNKLVATLGDYIYFLGMDVVMVALLQFTMAYCRLQWPDKRLAWFVYALISLDVVQFLLNPLFHHAFDTEAILLDGKAYYRLIPFLGQSYHRLVDYGIFLAVIIIFFIKMIRSPKIYFERYSVIFFSMIFIGAWETFYIFSRSPVDRSMVGFAVFGLLIFYFALYYRPLRLLDRMLANIASEMSEALYFFDAIGRCVWANNPGIKLADIDEEDLDQAQKGLEAIFENIDLSGNEWMKDLVLGSGAGAKYYHLEMHAVEDNKGHKVGSFLSVRDQSAQQQELLREKYNASHDNLTDLFTREYLYEQISAVFQEHPDEKYIICYLDVRDFKIVNDIFGNEFGDFAIKSIADSLRKNLPKGCIYGRLGGDTFGMCIHKSQFDEVKAEQFLKNFIVKDNLIEHQLILHQGLYEVNEPDLDVSLMFDRAHLALTTIKNDYKQHIIWYDDRMRDDALWNQQITSDLAQAIREGQIRPYLQAMVDNNGKILGAEALVRWIHPLHGFLSPDKFIPIFEKNGMIADVDRHMWRCACQTLARWTGEGYEDLFISINISPKDFYFMDVVAELKSIVREYDISPSRLRVEITETIMMTDNENRIRILHQLKDAGFIVEMDDFGSGYSSLNMLKDMPVDVLKIDMLFLNETNNDARSETILRNILNLTKDLGISSLTEGVETKDQYQMLSRMGCKLFQGYYFSKPISVEAFEKLYFEASESLPWKE